MRRLFENRIIYKERKYIARENTRLERLTKEARLKSERIFADLRA